MSVQQWSDSDMDQLCQLLDAGTTTVACIAAANGVSAETCRKRLDRYRARRPLPCQPPAPVHECSNDLNVAATAPLSKPPPPKLDPRKDPLLHVDSAPEHYHLSGVSTQRKVVLPDGSEVLQWVKTARDPASQRLELLRSLLDTLPESYRAEPVPAPEQYDNDALLCAYPIGDPHLGMYSWAAETGEDYDLATGERLLTNAIDKLVALAPAANDALILNLGDFFHSDNSDNRTSRNGNALDVDGRWAKVLQVGMNAMYRIVGRALERHQRVRAICEIGNHDDQSAIMLALALKAYYRDEPRVTIDTSPDPFHWFRFGQCLLATTHGQMCKPDKLPGVMAATRPVDWGETKHRMWYTGHVHHESVKEYPGCVVESFRTLAPRDLWHHQSGYRAGRDMRCDVWHREHGPVTRHIVGVERVA